MHMHLCGLHCLRCTACHATDADADRQHRTGCRLTTAQPPYLPPGVQARWRWAPSGRCLPTKSQLASTPTPHSREVLGSNAVWAGGAWLLLSESGWQGCPDAFHSGESCPTAHPPITVPKTVQIARALKHFCHFQRATMVVGLLQPQPETFDEFDEGEVARCRAGCGTLCLPWFAWVQSCRCPTLTFSPSLPSAPWHRGIPALWCCMAPPSKLNRSWMPLLNPSTPCSHPAEQRQGVLPRPPRAGAALV